jgi:uncharacterized damage-inducible protein DinB
MTVEAGSQLAADLERSRTDLETARNELLQTLSRLSDSDLQRAPRGQWSVQRVLEHVLQSERLYAAGLAHLQGQPQPDQSTDIPSDLSGFVRALDVTRKTALDLLDGASESTFYEIRPLGHEEYSPLSLLENVAMHDREHAAQIEQIMAES